MKEWVGYESLEAGMGWDSTQNQICVENDCIALSHAVGKCMRGDKDGCWQPTHGVICSSPVQKHQQPDYDGSEDGSIDRTDWRNVYTKRQW